MLSSKPTKPKIADLIEFLQVADSQKIDFEIACNEFISYCKAQLLYPRISWSNRLSSDALDDSDIETIEIVLGEIQEGRYSERGHFDRYLEKIYMRVTIAKYEKEMSLRNKHELFSNEKSQIGFGKILEIENCLSCSLFLDCLSETDRFIVRHRMDAFDFEYISNELEISISAVRKRHERAIQKLKRLAEIHRGSL